MIWLLVVPTAVAATPFLLYAWRERGQGPSHETTQMARWGKWIVVGSWALCVLAVIGYISVSKIVGCWREDSVHGRESWSIVPFGQVCTFDATQRRVAEITRPGWTLTVCIAFALIGLVVLMRQAKLRRD